MIGGIYISCNGFTFPFSGSSEQALKWVFYSRTAIASSFYSIYVWRFPNKYTMFTGRLSSIHSTTASYFLRLFPFYLPFFFRILGILSILALFVLFLVVGVLRVDAPGPFLPLD